LASRPKTATIVSPISVAESGLQGLSRSQKFRRQRRHILRYMAHTKQRGTGRRQSLLWNV